MLMLHSNFENYLHLKHMHGSKFPNRIHGYGNHCFFGLLFLHIFAAIGY
jgi:hypothetical protein